MAAPWNGPLVVADLDLSMVLSEILCALNWLWSWQVWYTVSDSPHLKVWRFCNDIFTCGTDVQFGPRYFYTEILYLCISGLDSSPCSLSYFAAADYVQNLKTPKPTICKMFSKVVQILHSSCRTNDTVSSGNGILLIGHVISPHANLK